MVSRVFGVTTPSDREEAAAYLARFAERLRAQGLRVLVLSLDPNPSLPTALEIPASSDRPGFTAALLRGELGPLARRHPDRAISLAIGDGAALLEATQGLRRPNAAIDLLARAIEPLRSEFDCVVVAASAALQARTGDLALAVDWAVRPTEPGPETSRVLALALATIDGPAAENGADTSNGPGGELRSEQSSR